MFIMVKDLDILEGEPYTSQPARPLDSEGPTATIGAKVVIIISK